MSMKIVALTSLDQSLINIVAKWLWSEWGSDGNFNYWKSWVESSTLIDKIPQTFVAIDNNKCLGTVSLWRCDLQSRQDVFPWMGGLYVDVPYRNMGIGAALQDHVFKIAGNLGHKKLFMFTILAEYFERFGWRFVEEIPDETGNMVKLYLKNLSL